MATYLNKQKVATLQQAAKLADEFTLTHKMLFGKWEFPQNFATKPDVTMHNVQSPRPKADRSCYYCLKTGHLIVDCKSLETKAKVGYKAATRDWYNKCFTLSLQRVPVVWNTWLFCGPTKCEVWWKCCSTGNRDGVCASTLCEVRNCQLILQSRASWEVFDWWSRLHHV